jgi:hypothetical protein
MWISVSANGSVLQRDERSGQRVDAVEEREVEVGAHLWSSRPQTRVPLRRTQPMARFTHFSYSGDTAAMATACDPMLLMDRIVSEAFPGTQTKTGEAFESTSLSLESRWT